MTLIEEISKKSPVENISFSQILFELVKIKIVYFPKSIIEQTKETHKYLHSLKCKQNMQTNNILLIKSWTKIETFIFRKCQINTKVNCKEDCNRILLCIMFTKQYSGKYIDKLEKSCANLQLTLAIPVDWVSSLSLTNKFG